MNRFYDYSTDEAQEVNGVNPVFPGGKDCIWGPESQYLKHREMTGDVVQKDGK
jgi:hypothetical protein